MFAVRATQRLLSRGVAPTLGKHEATTLLGDWYATVLVLRPEHLVLAVSERTMLSVVVPAKNVPELPSRIASAAREVLLNIGVAPSLVEVEFDAMQDAVFAKTSNRSVLGGLNDFVFQLKYAYQAHPGWSLADHALRLGRTPSGVIEQVFPDRATKALFETKALLGRARSAV